MFYNMLNTVIGEINSVIKFMLKNKIFLFCLTVAIIVIFLGFIYKLNRYEWIAVLLSISISMILAMEYADSHVEKKEKRMLTIGSALIFHTIITIIIGSIVFYDKTIKDQVYIYTIIHKSKDLVYLICLIIPALITIFAKIIFKKGEPLYGGIISGHSAFVSALFLINYRAGTSYALLIVPSISILIPRCIDLARGLKTPIKTLGTISMVLLLISTIKGQGGIVLISANLIMLILVLICQQKPVHKKIEICLGILVGTIFTLSMLYFFN